MTVSQPKSYSWVWAVLLAVIIFASAVRIRLRDIPLERDEGEYAYAGQLILQGVPPYSQVYNMKMPGIYAAYALIMAVFGQTCSGIHLGVAVVNAATILLVFLLAKRFLDAPAALVSAAVFAILSLGQKVFGFTANSEHFVIFFAVGGILLLMQAIERQNRTALFGGSVLLGTAFLMKQHGAAFIVFAGLYLLFSELRRPPFVWKKLAVPGILFLIGVLLPFAVTCLILKQAGVFEKFWFWTFVYAQKYVSTIEFKWGMQNLTDRTTKIVGSAVLVWILAGVGLAALFWNKKIKSHRIFIAGFLIFSFLSICPGLYFREHYFILLLPAIAVLAGAGATLIIEIFSRSQSPSAAKVMPVLLLLAVLLSAVYQQREYFFVTSPYMVSRSIYGGNPFPESPEIARFLRENSSENDRIAVIGSEPQIYFYANRRSATGYIYTYSLMETHSYARKMQEEMIGEIEKANPKFLVFVNVSTSWLPWPDSEKMILDWFWQYQKKYYNLVGIIDILGRDKNTVYRWGKDASTYLPMSTSWMAIYQRANASFEL